jgi:hypothetical protein
MKIPSIDEADRLLLDAETSNPGEWIGHSRNVARAAGIIAALCGLDADAAYIFGLLHDIGRKFGVIQVRHTVDGYGYLKELGYDDAAKICISHGFPTKNHECIIGKNDLNASEMEFVKNELQFMEYDDYDRLIHLCDLVSYPGGFVLLEKRLVDIGLRKGLCDSLLEFWKSAFECKKYFEEKMDLSIYDVLPGVRDNTFSF